MLREERIAKILMYGESPVLRTKHVEMFVRCPKCGKLMLVDSVFWGWRAAQCPVKGCHIHFPLADKLVKGIIDEQMRIVHSHDNSIRATFEEIVFLC